MKSIVLLGTFLISTFAFGQIDINVPSVPCPPGTSEAVYATGKKLSDNIVKSLEGLQVENCSFSKKREVFALKYQYQCDKAAVSVQIYYVMCEPSTVRVKSFTVKNIND